jgi:hypothetical protein
MLLLCCFCDAPAELLLKACRSLENNQVGFAGVLCYH